MRRALAQAGVAGPLGGALAGFVGGTAGGRGLGKAAQNVDWTQFQQPGRDLLKSLQQRLPRVTA